MKYLTVILQYSGTLKVVLLTGGIPNVKANCY